MRLEGWKTNTETEPPSREEIGTPRPRVVVFVTEGREWTQKHRRHPPRPGCAEKAATGWCEEREEGGEIRQHMAPRKTTQERCVFPLCGCQTQEDQEFDGEYEIPEHILTAYYMPEPC